jgi:tight adherence protein B
MTLLIAISTFCLAIAVFLFLNSGFHPVWRWFRLRSEADIRKYQSWIDELFLGWPPEQTRHVARSARIAIIMVFVLTLILTGSMVFAAVAAYGTYWIPSILYRTARERRLSHIEDQLPDAVSMMVSSVRAGSSLSTAIAAVAQKMPEPLSQEFGVITREHQVGGISLEEALARARSRVNVESLKMVTTALIISSNQGGDLLEIMERMATATLNMSQLKRKIFIETSEVRIQEKIILALTPLFALLVCLFDPAIPQVLFHSLAGNLVLVTVLVLQVVAIFWIRGIVRTAI